jgi:hypothetical protein
MTTDDETYVDRRARRARSTNEPRAKTPAGPALAWSATLDDVDRPAWPPAPRDATWLVQRVHELRRKPLAQ